MTGAALLGAALGGALRTGGGGQLESLAGSKIIDPCSSSAV